MAKQLKEFLILGIHGSEFVGLKLRPLYPGCMDLRVDLEVVVGRKIFLPPIT
jgi:hypothetical protein